MQRAGSMFTNFLLFGLLLVSVFVIFTIFANIRERRAAENWTQTFGDIEDIPKQYPLRNDNDSAVQLEILTNRLGIDFANYGEPRRYSALSSDVRRFSDYHKKIEEVRDHILTSPPILWAQNMEGRNNWGQGTGFPRINAILELERILTVRASKLAAAKNYVDAEKYLEAGWRLNDSLRSRPEVDLQLMAIEIDQELMGLMRELPVDREWISRLTSHNYEKAIIKGFQLEAWFLWRMRNEKPLARGSMINDMLDPYVHLSVASLLENERKEIEQIQALSPCSLGIKDFREVEPNPAPRWNRIRKPWALFDKHSAYGRITKLRIDRELTAKIIQVRHGYFPKDGIEKSETCKNGVWNFSKLPDGTTSIQYAGRLEQPTRPMANLPTSFVVNGNPRSR